MATKKAIPKKVAKPIKKTAKAKEKKKVEEKKDPRDQQTKAANDTTLTQKERSQREAGAFKEALPDTKSQKSGKSDKPKIEKSNKDASQIEEAVQKLLDRRNEFLEKVDEANEGVTEEASTEQVNSLRDSRSLALTNFQAEWIEFQKLMESELKRTV